MRTGIRWTPAVAMAATGFGLSWWVCQKLIQLDEGVSLAVAGAVLAVVLAVAGWWTAQGGGDVNTHGREDCVVQKARAGRDVNMAGRDQTIINYRQRDE
jgi:hypothetical protein